MLGHDYECATIKGGEPHGTAYRRSECQNGIVENKRAKQNRAGVAFPRYFTARLEAGKTPYDEVQWETRTASIGNDKGSVIFEQRDIEVPVDWSQTATNIVASKYFHGKLGSPERETSVAQLVHRVVDTIAGWGQQDGYFATEQDGENFRDELAHLMLTRRPASTRRSGSTWA